MTDRIHHSEPISIPASNHNQYRNRSASVSSDDDDSYSPPLRTPYQGPAPRVANAQSPSTSPIFSYFFQVPTKSSSAGLPPSPSTNFGTLGRGVTARPPQEKPIMEEVEEHGYGNESALLRHARRVSTSATWASPPSRAPFNPVMPSSEASERGAGLLRRLSLGSALVRPQVSPPRPTAALAPAAPVEVRALAPSQTPSASAAGRKKQRRSTTLGAPGEASARVHRSPSPMGERILKGHFDGFN